MKTDQPDADDAAAAFVKVGGEDYRWTEAAYDLIAQGHLHARIERRNSQRRVVVSGRCPHCCHDVAFEHFDRVQAVTRLRQIRAPEADSGDGWEEAEVRCSCREPHPGRPPGVDSGCGISFIVSGRPDVIS